MLLHVLRTERKEDLVRLYEGFCVRPLESILRKRTKVDLRFVNRVVIIYMNFMKLREFDV